MKLEYRKLDATETTTALADRPGWNIVHDQLSKEFTFSAYLEGVKFATKVGNLAEELNHHPDILIRWCKVTVSVNTHDVNGISPYDFELARLVDQI